MDDELDKVLYENIAEVRNLWLKTLPSDIDIPEHKFSLKFNRKMRKLIREQNRSPKLNNTIRHFKKTTIAILIAASVALVGCMSVEEYRTQMLSWAVQVFHRLTDYRFESDQTNGSLPDVNFSYMPVDMEKIIDEKHEMSRYLSYENKNGKFVSLNQTIVLESTRYNFILDTEDAYQETYYLGDIEMTLIYKNDYTIIWWAESNVIYKLSGNIDKEELKKIAEKIN